MKKVLLSAVALLAFGFANAQEEKSTNGGFAKGDLFVSGAVVFSNTSEGDAKESNFEIAPQIGYFLTENIAIGGKVGYESMKEDNAAGVEIKDMSGFTAGVFGRYYFTPANQFSLFANLGVDYTNMQNNLGSSDYKENEFEAGLGLGLNYFVSSNFSLEAGVGVLKYTTNDNGGDGADATNEFTFGGDWRVPAVSFGVNYKF